MNEQEIRDAILDIVDGLRLISSGLERFAEQLGEEDVPDVPRDNE